ncbi:family 16 glycosylhydrolase [Paenibacillus sp. IB182496]|uniref:Family 16 glycosylhydrolase n=1 Tax=Paenibacillus sabuli TaxID=2772509 RepID=A0A927BT44_9BACL|nr:sugar-binding protein [Paenibacillus sabuli]MBD2845044.1 family 16 glycosylhydrolase [Paenibacillus sabuli]
MRLWRLRKQLVGIMVISLLTGMWGGGWSWPAAAADIWTVDEDWESYATDDVPAGAWSVGAVKGGVKVAAAPGGTGLAVRLHNDADVGNTNKSNVYLKRSFEPVESGRIAVRFSYLSVNKKWNRMLHLNNLGNMDRYVALNETGSAFTYTVGGASGVLLEQYEANRWYEIEVVVNLDTQQVEAIAVDGDRKAEGVPLGAPVTRIASLFTMTGDTMGGADYYIDNLRVYRPEPAFVLQNWPTTLMLPAAGERSGALAAAVADQVYGTIPVQELLWSVSPAVEGFALDGTSGSWTLSSDTVPATVSVRAASAEAPSVYAERQLELIPYTEQLDRLVLSATETVYLPPGGSAASEPFAAVAVGMADEVLEGGPLTWSLPGSPAGMSIDAVTGRLTVEHDAAAAATLVRAALTERPDIYGELSFVPQPRYQVADDYEDGMPESYTVSEVRGSVQVAPGGRASGHALELRNDHTVGNGQKSVVSFRRAVEPVTEGKAVVEFDYYTERKTYHRMLYAYDATEPIVRIDGNNTSITYRIGDTTGTLLDTYEPQRWYRFRLELDLTAQLVTAIEVDGDRKAADLPFASPVDALRSLYAATADTFATAAFRIDHLRVGPDAELLELDRVAQDKRALELVSPVRADLPHTGADAGSAIAWSASIPGVVGENGELLRDWEDGPSTVDMMAELVYGGAADVKVFPDTVVYPRSSSVISQVYDIVPSGAARVAIPEEGDAVRVYTAAVYDQFGQPMPTEAVNWSLEEATPGVTLVAATGELTIEPAAQAGTVGLTASSVGTPWVQTTKRVVLYWDDPPVNDKPGWELTFHDNFINPQLDESKWNPHYHYAGTPANYVLEDGLLKLRLTPGTGSTHVTTKRFGVEGEVLPDTFEDFSQQYGLFEMRAKVYRAGPYDPGGPVTGGYHSAFWMMPFNPNYAAQQGYSGLNHGTPVVGVKKTYDEVMEIDAYEYNWQAYHFGQGYPPALLKSNENFAPELTFDPKDDFHVYTLEWNREQLIFYLDGEETWRADRSAHTPFFMYLSLYEGSGWTGTPDLDPSTYPKDFAIDYIKVYQYAQGAQIALTGADDAFGQLDVPDVRLYDEVFRQEGEYRLELDPYRTTYEVALPDGTTAPPVIAGRAYHAETAVTVTQAVYFPGTADVTVAPHDGTPARTYAIRFVRESDRTEPFPLAAEIQQVKRILAAAEPGTAYNQYPQAAIDALLDAEEEARLAWDSALTQTALDEALADLQAALDDFAAAEVLPVASYGTPLIDGSVDALWTAAETLEVDKPDKGTTDSEAQVRVMWDEDNLYVLAEVTDDTPHSVSPSTNAPWNSDSIEVFLDEWNIRQNFVDGVRQIRADRDGQVSGKTKNGYTRDVYEVELADVEAVAVAYAGGYRVEMKIPFAEATGTAGSVMGFDLQLNDTFAGTAQDATLVFRGGGSAPPGQWSRLRLVGP